MNKGIPKGVPLFVYRRILCFLMSPDKKYNPYTQKYNSYTWKCDPDTRKYAAYS